MMMAHVVVFTFTVHVSITCQSHALISLVKINLMLSEIEAVVSCPALVELDLRM